MKTSLSKGGGRKTRKQRICQVPIPLSFAAKLQFSGCGKRKVSAFVYVKHQVCRVGKWEWRAGWRIFLLWIWTFVSQEQRVQSRSSRKRWYECILHLKASVQHGTTFSAKNKALRNSLLKKHEAL